MSIKLIGLTGYAGTGKDTVRAVLDGLGWHGLAFADPIRIMLHELLTSCSISPEWMHDRELKEKIIPEIGASYRHMAQTLGTEWGRSCMGSKFWCKLAQSYIDKNTLTDSNCTGFEKFVISDVRFVNEAKWVRDHGGVIWRVERPQAVPVRSHVSEAEFGNFSVDAVIQNDGSFADLKNGVTEALENLTTTEVAQ